MSHRIAIVLVLLLCGGCATLEKASDFVSDVFTEDIPGAAGDTADAFPGAAEHALSGNWIAAGSLLGTTFIGAFLYRIRRRFRDEKEGDPPRGEPPSQHRKPTDRIPVFNDS